MIDKMDKCRLKRLIIPAPHGQPYSVLEFADSAADLLHLANIHQKAVVASVKDA